MWKKTTGLAALAATLTVAGCSSSKPSSTGSTNTTTGASGNATKTITVGILTDLTGPAASGNKTSVQGVQAGQALATAAGYKIKYYVGDTTTSPSTALSAAKQMVEQDHVDVVIADSALAFGAATYLTSQNIPVVGAAEDGPEWITAKNMFSVYGALDTTKVSTTYGTFFKMEGVTNVGALGYSISPSSAESAKAAGVSAKQAGLTVGYVNSSFPFGSTNVQPIAIAMKNAGVNGFTASVDPNTGFALITALRQVGDDLKVGLLPTGYGGDLLQAGPGALNSAQGVYFTSSYEPIEMHTAATQAFTNALKTIGITNDPTYAEYVGYVSVDLLMDALKTTGPNPTHAALISALAGVTDFNAAGLLGSHSLNMSYANRPASAIGVNGCYFITKLQGSTFQLVPGADPVCGTQIPGVSVSS